MIYKKINLDVLFCNKGLLKKSVKKIGINLNNRVPNHIKELDKCAYLAWTLDPVYYSIHFIWWTDVCKVKCC